MKRCSKCLLEKTLDNFYKSHVNLDGFEGSCKECKSLYIKEKWVNDIEYRQKHSSYYAKNLKYSKEDRQSDCQKCHTIINTKTAPNRTNLCRKCAKQQKNANWTKNNLDIKAANRAKRRAVKLNATPKWLTKEQLEEIEQFYTDAKELQWLSDPTDPLEVDHIIPLQGKDISGLHVPWNLQIIPKSLNCSKGNR